MTRDRIRRGLTNLVGAALVGAVLVAPAVSPLARAKAAAKADPSREKITITPVGVQVQGATALDKDEVWELTGFDLKPNTKALIQVETSEGGIVGLDEGKCLVTQFADDTGKKLEDGQNDLGEFFGTWYQISKNSQALVFMTKAERAPAADATGVRVKGKLQLLMATKKGRAKSKVLALRKGTTLAAGGYQLKVGQVGEDFFSEKHSIELHSSRDLAGLISITLRDDKGRVIKSAQGGSGKMSAGRKTTWTRSITVDKVPARAAIEVEYWTDLKSVEVPFDLEFGIGLTKRIGRPEKAK